MNLKSKCRFSTLTRYRRLHPIWFLATSSKGCPSVVLKQIDRPLVVATSIVSGYSKFLRSLVGILQNPTNDLILMGMPATSLPTTPAYSTRLRFQTSTTPADSDSEWLRLWKTPDD